MTEDISFEIHPVKAPAHDVVLHEYLPTHPALMAIVAPRKSGKTTLLINMLTRPDMFKNFFHIIHVWSPTLLLDAKWQKVTKHLPPEALHMHFSDDEFLMLMEEIADGDDAHIDPNQQKTRQEPKPQTETKKRKKKPNVLFVFDDSASEKGLFSRAFTSPTTKAAFTSRHYNISIWLVSQSYKAISPGFRNNIFHWIIFDTPNEREADKMAEELSGPLNSKMFIKLLKDTTREPYQFLYINFESPNKLDYFRKGFGAPIDLTPYLQKNADMLDVSKPKKTKSASTVQKFTAPELPPPPAYVQTSTNENKETKTELLKEFIRML
jgi:hypothetical protein